MQKRRTDAAPPHNDRESCRNASGTAICTVGIRWLSDTVVPVWPLRAVLQVLNLRLASRREPKATLELRLFLHPSSLFGLGDAKPASFRVPLLLMLSNIASFSPPILVTWN